MVRVTSKCTRARSLSVKPIFADSRSPSPFGEIVVRSSLSPWNGLRSAVVGVEVRDRRRRPVDPQRGRSELAAALDEADQVAALRHATPVEAAVPAQAQKAAPLRRREPAERLARRGGELHADALGPRQLGADAQPALERREVARRDGQLGRVSGRDERQGEDEQGEAAHASRMVVTPADGRDLGWRLAGRAALAAAPLLELVRLARERGEAGLQEVVRGRRRERPRQQPPEARREIVCRPTTARGRPRADAARARDELADRLAQVRRPRPAARSPSWASPSTNGSRTKLVTCRARPSARP